MQPTVVGRAMMIGEKPYVPSDKRARVAVADKNPVMRAGLADLVRRDSRFELAGVVATGAAFLELCSEHDIDVGVIGWSLADMNGGEVLAALKKRQEPVRGIIYTGEPVQQVLHPTIRAGGWGFVSKSDESAVLLDAIAAVARGRLSFPYVDIERITADPLDILTTRERELLGALAQGWSNQQIAARIGISRNTVKYHLKNLYDKLGVANRAMAVALYVSLAGSRQ
jgi:two-component system nitrate/nitrite response regulator NarP